MLARIASGVLACFLFASAALAQFVVPSGAAVQLNGAALDLAGTALQVGGTFGVGSGSIVNATDILIANTGLLNGGSGTITLSGNWSNLGGFVGGTSSVFFVDGPPASAVSGNSTFHNASFVSTNGKSYVFAVGSTQSINGLLTILGTAAQGIQFKSSTAGQVAFIDLLPGGSQNIDFVGVSNVHAIGQHLAPTKTNDGGTGDAVGWFGSSGGGGGAVRPTPALSPTSLFLLALMLIGVATMRRRYFH